MKRLLSFMLFSITSALHAQVPDSNAILSLEKVWSIVDKGNSQLRLSGLATDQSNIDLQLAKDKRIPELTGNANFGRNTTFPLYKDGLFSRPDYVPISRYGYGFGYSLNVNIYNGGKDKRNIEIKKEEIIRSQNEYTLQQSNVRYAVAVAYFDLYKFMQFKEFLASEISAEKKQLATIESMHRNGTVLKSDILRTNVKVSQLELSYADVQKKISIAKQRLNIFMGREQNTPVQIAWQEDPGTAAGVVDTALEQSPAYRIALNNVNLSALNIQQAKSDLLPKLSLFSFYDFSYPQIAFYPYSQDWYGFGKTGIKLSMPIDYLYKSKHSIAKARNIHEQETVKFNIKKDELSIDIREAYLQEQQALEAVQTALQNIVQSTESVRVIRSSYMNQESLLTDLLDAENILLEAKFSLTSAKVNVQLSHIRLLVKTGIL